MITTDFIIKEHLKIVTLLKELNSTSTVISKSNLESAVNSVYATWEGKDVYPTKELKCLRMLFVLIKSHAFVDGNKRVAAFIFVYMIKNLKANISINNNTLVSITRGIANNSITWLDLCRKFNQKLEESVAESIRYSYDGPVFRFGQHWDFTDGKITTEAKSKKQAINNIVYRLKVQYGLDLTCNLSIYEPYLKEEPFTTKEYSDIMKELSKETKPRKCPNCGTELNGLEDCPICDYFEYDLIED